VPAPADTPVAILCGGRGTRLQEHTREIPKALVEIGGEPILWHVMRIYAAQGYTSFRLLTGHKGSMIEDWLAGADLPDGIEARCVDTGEDTPTGGRIQLARDEIGSQRFLATYADGVADIDLAGLVAHHEGAGAAAPVATMTVIRPHSQWGIAHIDDADQVMGFEEKPKVDYWINGGFFCFEPEFFDYLREDSVLEQAPLSGVAADRKLRAYRHEGFWECMDTYKDATQLNDLWASGEAPWKVWGDQPAAAGGAG
jgi:glucose-1-phosphate cytidylyltransferase